MQAGSSQWRLTGLLPFTLALACGGGTPADAGGPTWLLEAQQAAGSTGVYSMMTADSTVAAAYLPTDQATLTCSEFLSDIQDGGDRWFVVIGLGVPASGSSVSVGGGPLATTASNASVTIYHQELTQTVGWSTSALSGELTLSSFPADSSAVSTPMTGHLTALFVDNPVSTIDCQSGAEALPDGGLLIVPGVCACQDADGGTSTCTLPDSGTNQSCCDGGIDTTNGYQLSFDFNATGCSGM